MIRFAADARQLSHDHRRRRRRSADLEGKKVRIFGANERAAATVVRTQLVTLPSDQCPIRQPGRRVQGKDVKICGPSRRQSALASVVEVTWAQFCCFPTVVRVSRRDG